MTGCFPRTVQVLAVFFLLFLLVYLVGYFNLSTIASRDLCVKGMITFGVHFTFLIAAVAHLARRERAVLLAGGELVLRRAGRERALRAARARLRRGDERRRPRQPSCSSRSPARRPGFSSSGVTGGAQHLPDERAHARPEPPGDHARRPAARPAARLPAAAERGNSLRVPLAVALAALFVVSLATISRSALLGLGVGLLVLAIPYGRPLPLRARSSSPLAAARWRGRGRGRPAERLLRVDPARARRTWASSTRRPISSSTTCSAPVLGDKPLFGLGKNTFSAYYEFLTGKSNWGPHSYYISVVTESGLVGAVALRRLLVYVFQRLGAARRIGSALSAAGDSGAALMRALAWGITAALVGTMAANVFYLTMQMYYFTGLVVLALAVPLLLARRARAVAGLAGVRVLVLTTSYPRNEDRLRGALPRRHGRAAGGARRRGRPARAGSRLQRLRARIRRGHVHATSAAAPGPCHRSSSP